MIGQTVWPQKPGSLAPPGFELNPALRCYRYDPNTASPPHFDKAGVGPEVFLGSGGNVLPAGNGPLPTKTAKEAVGDPRTGQNPTTTVSAYTVVIYLNNPNDHSNSGDTQNGGETTFFAPLVRENGVTENLITSKKGLTWAIGDGKVPLVGVSARVFGNTGDVLFFPHGTTSKIKGKTSHPSPLHEGSALIGDAKKFVLRTDVFFTS
jgi:hypothetical protein